jgi:hypothetical protein
VVKHEACEWAQAGAPLAGFELQLSVEQRGHWTVTPFHEPFAQNVLAPLRQLRSVYSAVVR